MDMTPQSLAGLSLAEKRMLLAQLLQERASQTAPTFPLSHGQRGMWFLYQLDRKNPAYNVGYASRIRSPLDLGAFRKAVESLVDRHPSLRTTFEECAGELCQRVHENWAVPLNVIDASAWTEDALREHVEREANRPFPLEEGPLFRINLYVRGPEDYIFFLGLHHIVGDFWSLIVVIEEMQALYPAACAGIPLELPTPAKDYRDFVRSQDELLAGPEGERLWQYWERQLAGVPVTLDLPTDRPRPALFSTRGGAAHWKLDPALLRQIKSLAASENVTLYTILLAAFQIVLGRYSGQDDFVVGSPFAGRNRPGFENMIGYFINMLPLRADLSGDPPFRDMLRRLGVTVLDALEHQDYPFARIVEQLNVERDLSRSPLVQVSFTLEKSHRPQELGAWRFFLPPSGAKLNVGGLQLEQFYIEQRSSQFDLEMVFEEGDGTLEGLLRHNSDLFDPETAARMVSHFLLILESIAANPDRRLSELPSLTADERRLVLDDWSRNDVPFAPPLCLHQLFEQQAARTPDAVALIDDQQSLTYAELDARANRLAHHLSARGVRPGVNVALCLERSPEMIVAILGTLKAGAAYVPIEPATPADRIRLVVADAQSPFVVTQRSVENRLHDISTPLICIDDLPSFAGYEDSRPPDSGVTVSDLAYIIYTSGSTGRPKGVMVEHRAIANTIHWRDQDLAIFPTDRVLYHLSYSFDPSLCIIFPTLAVGARLVLAPPGEEYDPRALLERVMRERVTILEASTLMLRLMVDHPLLDACQSVRWVCCGGEAMPMDLPGRLLDRLNVDLYNLYGPTEAAVDTTWWKCQKENRLSSVPIGRPIANAKVYILDPAMNPVPPGVPGELYIGGAGLARGYLGDAQTTAERFVPDPFSELPEARLYRSGDRARWRSDGVIEFLGRFDHQVKIRGFRVELGEVENALLRQPTIREASVIHHAPNSEAARLVAYVVPTVDDAPVALDVLRRHLRSTLPEYMVPSTFVIMSKLPRTSGSKVDRRALPPPPSERPQTAGPVAPPRTPLEVFLVDLWREVLHLERVGIHDNFFELGGNSIQGAVLINRLQEKLGEQVYVIALFDAPTVAGLAHYLVEANRDAVARLFDAESLTAEASASPGLTIASHGPKRSELLVPLQTQGAKSPWFMVHPPGGIVVCYQALAHRLKRDRPFFGIRSRGLHGETELPETMEAMAEEYVAAIRDVQPAGPYLLGGWSVGGLVALEMAQQLLALGEPVQILALLDSTPPPRNGAFEDPGGREYGLDISLDDVGRLGPDEQLPYLWQHALKLGLIEPEVPLHVAHQVLNDLKRLFHHHMLLANEYQARFFPGRLTLLRPSDAPFALATTRDKGWSELAASVAVHFVPGQHHSMVKEPAVRVLAETLDTALDQSEAAERPKSRTVA